MRTRFATSGIAFLSAALLFCGCGGPQHVVEDPEDQGIIETDHIGLREIEPAVEAICVKIDKLNARGWPAHVLLTPDAPHLPQVRIAKIQNRTAQYFDLVTLENILRDAMIDRGVVYVLANEGDLEAVNRERDYSQAGMTSEEIEYGQEDRTSMVLTGEITDDIIRQGDRKQHDYIFQLRLTDTVKARAMAASKTKIRKTRID